MRNDQYTNYKYCSMCGRPMPLDIVKDCCPACEEDALFKEVREYIRSHDVTEYELAEIFHISQGKVRRWIKEGRIEYVDGDKKMMHTRCQRCGAPVTFGTLCPDCLRLMNGSKEVTYHAGIEKRDSGRMRSLPEDE